MMKHVTASHDTSEKIFGAEGEPNLASTSAC
jgi:hypothetical protein